MKQVQIEFDVGLTQIYPAFTDVVKAVVYGCGKPLKTVAADMDLSQSELSRKLADNPNDPRSLNVDEIPLLIESTGDKGKDLIYWLVEKYLQNPKHRRERAEEMLVEMAPQFMALMKEIAPDNDLKVVK